MDVAEIIADLNRTQGVDPTPPPEATPPVTTTVPPAAPPAPPPQGSATPPLATPPVPGAQPATTVAKEKVIPPDPSFVRNPVDTPPAATPPAGAPPVAGTPAATTPPAAVPVPDEAFYNRLSEMTDGELKDEKTLVALVTKYNELLDQVQKGVEPKFASERAKWAYKALQASPGKELETAQRTIRALSLSDKIEKLAPKDLLFEAYLLDPINSDLSEVQAQKYFEDMYSKKYTDLENDLGQQRQQAVEIRQAKESISKISSEVAAIEAPSEQISKEVEESIGQAVGSFGGIKLALSDNPTDADYLTVLAEDAKEMQRFQKNALNPNKWLNEWTNQFRTPDGGFDYQAYTRELWEMVNHKRIRQETHDHGIKTGRLGYVKEQRNSTTPAEIAVLGNQPPAPPAEKSFMETWKDAQQKKAS